ncbi:PREDICTED: DNA dC-_dU-editing enzyme APOBEC-3H [Galeopterus variegatus]|uniref:single-stranded DNA cytosine deaminase n=1 Tax=Galeopterus variegatus TaxID=482537 RepID=A0ABM0RQS5_GALVR|nr:PREDICTED: DNA dC->dU-editing enzyme APOBEC-3H [Galeopterus variegatus]
MGVFVLSLMLRAASCPVWELPLQVESLVINPRPQSRDGVHQLFSNLPPNAPEVLLIGIKGCQKNTMRWLKEDVFSKQFNNQHRVKKPYYRRKTYLCYQLKLLNGPTLDKGCFQNKKRRHAEIRFIDKIRSMRLDPAESYEITCYLTWSPCPSCARELVEFINHHHHDHPRLRLRIFTSRLYCHWRKKHQEGLQLLCKSNVPVDVMKLPEFTDCWRNFVDEERPFEEWENLEQYSNSISQRLERILRSWNVNVLTDDFRNLQLGSPSPSSSASDSR